MSKVQWVRYKKGGGPRVRGNKKYDPPEPYDAWTKVLGVVARCEGNHDTVVMYDETGVTWGFMQWTFTSGRLQKLLESFKSIPIIDFETESETHETLFDQVCCTYQSGKQYFNRFGFEIRGGKFYSIRDHRLLNPVNKNDKKRIRDICMGRIANPGDIKAQKQHALALANLFGTMGTKFGIAEAQIQFAIQEFKRQFKYKRAPLKGKINPPTITALVNGYNFLEETETMPLAALFLNLWQNNPAAAYRLLLKARKQSDFPLTGHIFARAWYLACVSNFGNWGYGKSGNKSPRVVRIQKAIREFYDLPLIIHKK